MRNFFCFAMLIVGLSSAFNSVGYAMDPPKKEIPQIPTTTPNKKHDFVDDQESFSEKIIEDSFSLEAIERVLEEDDINPGIYSSAFPEKTNLHKNSKLKDKCPIKTPQQVKSYNMYYFLYNTVFPAERDFIEAHRNVHLYLQENYIRPALDAARPDAETVKQWQESFKGFYYEPLSSSEPGKGKATDNFRLNNPNCPPWLVKATKITDSNDSKFLYGMMSKSENDLKKAKPPKSDKKLLSLIPNEKRFNRTLKKVCKTMVNQYDPPFASKKALIHDCAALIYKIIQAKFSESLFPDLPKKIYLQFLLINSLDSLLCEKGNSILKKENEIIVINDEEIKKRIFMWTMENPIK